MAYALAADVATELGITFTSPQTTQATDLIAAAQSWIDAYTHRTFEASTTTTEQFDPVLETTVGSNAYASPVYVDGPLSLSVSNAGSAKSGTVTLYFK